MGIVEVSLDKPSSGVATTGGIEGCVGLGFSGTGNCGTGGISGTGTWGGFEVWPNEFWVNSGQSRYFVVYFVAYPPVNHLGHYPDLLFLERWG